ncbi:MAG: STAS domain-containing protein [Candidatus Omnitrophota bacterium]
MKTRKRRIPGFLCVEAIGDMEAYDAESFENDIFDLVDKGEKNIVTDLGGLVYICSSGLRAFLNIRAKLQKEGGRLVLSSLRDNVLEVFRVSKLLSIFEIVSSPKDIKEGS